MVTYATMLTEYARENPYATAVTGCLIGAGMVACAALSSKKAQKVATAVHQVVKTVQLSQDGTTCTITASRSNTKLDEFNDKIAVLSDRAKIKTVVLEFAKVHTVFSHLEIQQFAGQFPKLTEISGTVRQLFVWDRALQHVKITAKDPDPIIGSA